MIGLVYRILSSFVLAFISYTVLYTLNQKHLASLIKMANLVYIVSISVLFFAPAMTRVNQDVQEVRQDVRGVTEAINTINGTTYNLKSATGSIGNSPILNFGANPKLSGTLSEIFTGGHFDWPVKGEITQGFNDHNHGIDIASNAGVPILVARQGWVRFAGKHDVYGLYVLIDHERGFQTLYAHCSELKVKSGQSVWDNDVIGLVGSSGNSSGPHVHFEVRYSGKTVDPMKYLKKQ